jgi:hypothetical protein
VDADPGREFDGTDGIEAGELWIDEEAKLLGGLGSGDVVCSF